MTTTIIDNHCVILCLVELFSIYAVVKNNLILSIIFRQASQQDF